MRRYRIDHAHALLMAILERAGVFDAGPGDRSWLCVWRSGATPVSSLRLRRQAGPEMSGGLRLDFTTHQEDGRRVEHDYSIPVRPPTGQSGRGRSFLCPLVSDGTRCLRPCRVLYRPPNTVYFGCRQCHHLAAARRRGSRPTAHELAAEVETAERDLIQASALGPLLVAVRRLAAARARLAALRRSEIVRAHEVERLNAAAKAALRSPGPPTKESLQLYAKLHKVHIQNERHLRAEPDRSAHEPAALVLEVALIETDSMSNNRISNDAE